MIYKEILLQPDKSVVTSRSEIVTTKQLGKYSFGIPVIPANMKSILNWQTCQWFDDLNCFYAYHRMDGPQDVYDFTVWAKNNLNITSISVGITQEWLDMLKSLHLTNTIPDYITVDVAWCYNDVIIPIVEYIKKNFPETYLIVGNFTLPETVSWLENLGVDCAKWGVANGSACSTFNATHVRSEISELYESVDVAKTIKIIADGGFSNDKRSGLICAGEFAVAMAIGADFCMSGSAFAGCYGTNSANGGYFGNASEDAKMAFNHIEGVKITPPNSCRAIDDVVQYIQDSLQSCCSYLGINDVNQLNRKHLR